MLAIGSTPTIGNILLAFKFGYCLSWSIVWPFIVLSRHIKACYFLGNIKIYYFHKIVIYLVLLTISLLVDIVFAEGGIFFLFWSGFLVQQHQFAGTISFICYGQLVVAIFYLNTYLAARHQSKISVCLSIKLSHLCCTTWSTLFILIYQFRSDNSSGQHWYMLYQLYDCL